MNKMRAERIGQLIQQEIGDMLQKEVKDPRIGFVSITHVEVSQDLSVVKIFVSHLGRQEDIAESMAGLRSAAAFLRGEVGRRLKLRFSPQLDFRQDDSIPKSLHIQELIKTLPGVHDE